MTLVHHVTQPFVQLRKTLTTKYILRKYGIWSTNLKVAQLRFVEINNKLRSLRSDHPALDKVDRRDAYVDLLQKILSLRSMESNSGIGMLLDAQDDIMQGPNAFLFDDLIQSFVDLFDDLDHLEEQVRYELALTLK